MLEGLLDKSTFRMWKTMKMTKKNVPKETILRNTSKGEYSHIQVDKVLESDLVPRMLNEENYSPAEIIDCPDPDFNNFEKDTADDCFAVNQSWTIFYTTDAMPRFYALVKKVTFPFKVSFKYF